MQFTGAQWEYSCLAELEKQLSVDGDSWPADILPPQSFGSIIIDMWQMKFLELSGCKVGCFPVSELFHPVGISFFGHTIRLRSFEKGSESEKTALDGASLALLDDEISNPEVIEDNPVLDVDASHFTDNYSISIGGLHDVNTLDSVLVNHDHVQDCTNSLPSSANEGTSNI